MVTTRFEQAQDRDAIFDVHAAAFPSAAEAELVNRLRENDHLAVSVVAEQDGGIVGHVAFSPVTIDGCATLAPGLGLAPMAVLPDHQNRGIGSQLVRDGLRACVDRGCPYVVVLGHVSYYPRFGFQRARLFGLDNEYGVDEEFMVLELSQGCLKNVRGVVKYGPELSVFEKGTDG